VLVLSITRYRLQLAQEAFGQAVSPKNGDFAWNTFQKECFTLAKSNAPRHHSGKSDSFRLARLNINKQATRVVQWLSSGRGIVSTYCIVFFMRNSHNGSGEDPSLNAKIRFPIVREKLLFRYRLACAFSGHHI
jgi:hypothetical protein